MTCDLCKRQVTWRVERRGLGMVCRTCNDKAWRERRHADPGEPKALPALQKGT